MSDEFGIALVMAIAFFVGFMSGAVIGIKGTEVQAVDNGAAYWCIVDHEKVFSWEECK